MTDSPDKDARLAATVEAMLVATDSPLTAAKLSEIGELGGVRAAKKAIETLNGRYDETGAAFTIQEIAGGFQILTRPEHQETLRKLLQVRKDTRLTQAALETLAVVAYRQPVIRADIEVIRGVACGEVLRGLMDKQLVKIVGRAEVLGRPMLYGTTKRFLELFGLGSLEDLPNAEDLRQPASKPDPKLPLEEADPDDEDPDGEDDENEDDE